MKRRISPFQDLLIIPDPFLQKAKVIILLIPALILISCSAKYFPNGNVQRGIASWYGEDFHGKRTSSDEVYDMEAMTAAHKTLPFGSYVQVINLNNGKSVIVRINDRGPFVKGRIIDLSYAAAKRLGMAEAGVTPVEIRILKKFSPKKSSQKFSVQLGSFTEKRNAIKLRNKLLGRYNKIYISEFKTPSHIYYRVRIKTRSMQAAQELAEKLKKEGYPAQAIEDYKK